MTFREFCGDGSHREQYRRAIQKLGGLEAVIPFIPFSHKNIVRALQDGDEHLNSLPLAAWDLASGFVCCRADVYCVGSGLQSLLRQCGITSYSNSQLVCLLKEAAREWAEEVI